MLHLYSHNLRVYNNAVNAFKTGNRTCIIHPTGTGKSLVIANFIESNPDKKHLLLAPGVHIFNEIKKHTALYFKTSTYQNLIFNTAEKLNLLDCDFIYLDEFHRIGAIEWGSHLKLLLNANPKAKILGTTATHIRYLDDNRNMAEEIFDNNISSAMTLQEAIQAKILQAPKYLCALYNIGEVYKTLSGKILKSHHVNKKTIADQLRKSMIDSEKSNGIEQILSKHLTNDRTKILVFCRTKVHIDQMESIIMNGIKKILPTAVSLHIYSKYTSSFNEDALLKFSLEDDIPKVLFTVAMVSEGLHVKGNNTVILIRDTTSPIIYFQQLGRAFSVNQNQKPLIFDLVNNFDSVTGTLYDEYAEYRNEDRKANTKNKISSLADLVGVEFIDEVKDLAQMFHAYYQAVNTWNSRFIQASLFYAQHDHLNPKKGTSLSNWVGANRGFKRNNTIDADKIIKLESIGMIWEIDESVWNKMFEEAQVYYQENGHLSMKYKSTLKSWLGTNRKLKAENLLTE